MRKYKGIIYIIPILILSAVLSSCNSKTTQYTSKKESTQESVNANNLTYYEIMKAPYYYEGENVNFKGRIVEISKKDNNIMIKLAVNDKLEDTFIACGRDIEQNVEISNNNIINIGGVFTGIAKYKTINGEELKMPGIWINSLSVIK